MTLTVVILTMNEERHIARAIASVSSIAGRVFVIDSGSTDQTVKTAQDLGAEVLTHPFTNQAQQFNWALSQLPDDTDWVLRLDADEVVTPELAREMDAKLLGLRREVNGVVVCRRMTFLGRSIRWGGVFPIRIVRLLRHGKGRSEERWMDEHIIIEGEIAGFSGEIVDDNLNSLSWWTNKHNAYSSREAIELLNLDHGFLPREARYSGRGDRQALVKRWLKERAYAKLPGGLRAFAYFVYRYILCLGFLDGREGLAFHILQGFWYRFLVDEKVHEVRTYMRRHDVDILAAIHAVLGIRVDAPNCARVSLTSSPQSSR